MDKEYTVQKEYVVDGLGRKLYPTSLDELVPGGNVNLKPYAKKTEVKKDINKATDEIAKDYPDNSELAKALEEYTKKSEVDGIVQDKVDAAIEDLDIEKYIDEDEIAEKIEELALDSYAKKTELNEVDVTAQNALTKANNVEELLNGSFTTRISNAENDILGVKDRLSDDEYRIDGIEGSLGDAQSRAGEAYEKASEVESAVNDLEVRLEEDYATKSELEALDAAIANELDGCYSYTDDKFDSVAGRLDDFQGSGETVEDIFQSLSDEVGSVVSNVDTLQTEMTERVRIPDEIQEGQVVVYKGSGEWEAADLPDIPDIVPPGENDNDILLWSESENEWLPSDAFTSAQDNIALHDTRIGAIEQSYLPKEDAYDVDKKVFISGTAIHIADDRYSIAPLYEPQPGMMLAGDDFGEIIKIDNDKNIPDAELYYAGAVHAVPLNYDEDNNEYWFNAKDISQFPDELELGDVYVYLTSDGEFDYNKMFSDKYFASVAYLVADPIISLQEAIKEVADGTGQLITALNQEISGLKQRVSALERKVLVKYFTRVEADGINSNFILYSGDMTDNIIIEHVFINGVLDNDSLISFHDGYTYVDIRQENPRYSGNYDPVVLDAGDMITVEFYRWEN